MKTTLGVGISVLSALAAQGKDFDRTELNAMLDRLAASPEPKIEPDAGAMCYEMAEPRLESYEHQCRKCGAKTVYPPDQKEWRRYLRTLRNGALSLKAKGLNIELDDSCLCRKCGKEVFIAGENGLSITNRGKIAAVPQDGEERRKFGWRIGDELQIVGMEDGMFRVRPISKEVWIRQGDVEPNSGLILKRAELLLHPEDSAYALWAYDPGEKVKVIKGKAGDPSGWLRVEKSFPPEWTVDVDPRYVGEMTCLKENIGHPDRFRHLAWVINGRRIDARSSDIEILSAFLSNKRIVADEFDNQEPLKKYLPRLRKLLDGAGK